jgi:signal transduction histidine kinase
VTSSLFDLQLDEVRRLMMMKPPPGVGQMGSLPPRERFAIATIVRKTDGREGRGMMLAGGPGEGAWQIRVRHRSGSLESIVARSRRRNLAISLGVLGLLAAAVALVILSAQRQRRLAQQQMEFVAAVSHELRTPLAVICSAGENLADGVVADRPHVKRYGALIESEGRRLTDMVDRVMEFAGIGTRAPQRSRTDVNISAIVAEAVNGVSGEAHDRGVSVSLRSTLKSDDAAPVVAGDPDALRSAVQNIVGNAVKYSPGGGHVEVGVETAGPVMTIRISDHGLGIDSADLPHVFEPFYRGRRALDAQIRGTGVGLSIVRRVIDAHEGAIRIESRAGEGTTVTVQLPLTLAQTA